MLEKLAQIETNYEELTEQLSSPDIMSDIPAYTKLMKQHRSLGEIVEKYREVKKMNEDLSGAKEILELSDDAEMRELAELEIADIETNLGKADEALKFLLIPRDPNDEKMSFWKSAPERAATKRRFLRRKFCECMRVTPNGKDGKWKLWAFPTPESAALKTLLR